MSLKTDALDWHACRIVLAALDRDKDRVVELIGKDPALAAGALLGALYTVAHNTYGSEEAMREAFVQSAFAAELNQLGEER